MQQNPDYWIRLHTIQYIISGAKTKATGYIVNVSKGINIFLCTLEAQLSLYLSRCMLCKLNFYTNESRNIEYKVVLGERFRLCHPKNMGNREYGTTNTQTRCHDPSSYCCWHHSMFLFILFLLFLLFSSVHPIKTYTHTLCIKLRSMAMCQ